jgi:hypothetical protein
MIVSRSISLIIRNVSEKVYKNKNNINNIKIRKVVKRKKITTVFYKTRLMTDDCHYADSTELSALVPQRSHVMSRIKLITHRIIVE